MTGCLKLNEEQSREVTLGHCNRRFEKLSAVERVDWSLRHLPAQHVLSSSFGAQAAVTLHLLTDAMPDIPVILIDTGYLFPETYRFVDELRERLNLNLKIYRAPLSSAWQEARYGERWLKGRDGLDAYNEENKVQPMKTALRELNAGTWFAGLRRSQSKSRAGTQYLEWSGDRWKVHPIADWSDRDVHRYLKQHALPYHPLWHEGYTSIGDYHTSHSIHEMADESQTRFFGLQRECGLHQIDLSTI
jgi:phosphoadenosine phosphosulfate reductase